MLSHLGRTGVRAFHCSARASSVTGGQAVSKIDRLMALHSAYMTTENSGTNLTLLTDKLSATTSNHIRPSRLRGDLYSHPTANKPPKDIAPLPASKRMIDSYIEIDLRFSSGGEALREMYVGGLSRVRMGRLMEGE